MDNLQESDVEKFAGRFVDWMVQRCPDLSVRDLPSAIENYVDHYCVSGWMDESNAPIRYSDSAFERPAISAILKMFESNGPKASPTFEMKILVIHGSSKQTKKAYIESTQPIEKGSEFSDSDLEAEFQEISSKQWSPSPELPPFRFPLIEKEDPEDIAQVGCSSYSVAAS
jgi:hypothetical protein